MALSNLLLLSACGSACAVILVSDLIARRKAKAGRTVTIHFRPVRRARLAAGDPLRAVREAQTPPRLVAAAQRRSA